MKAVDVEEVVAAVRELLERGKSLRLTANPLEKSGR
jgi:hypothetical protein